MTFKEFRERKYQNQRKQNKTVTSTSPKQSNDKQSFSQFREEKYQKQKQKETEVAYRENSYINHLKKNSLLSSSGISMDGLRSVAPQDSAMSNQQSEYERLSTYDINAGKAELEALRKKLGSSKDQWESDLNSETNMWTDDNAFQSYKRQNEELKSQILKLEREINQAERFQKAKSYDIYRNAEDFPQYSKAGASKRESKDFSLFEKGDDLYDYINNIDDYRNTVKAVAAEESGDENGHYEYDLFYE